METSGIADAISQPCGFLLLSNASDVYDSSERMVADQNGWRYYARIALRQPDARDPSVQSSRRSVAFYDETGNYVGSAPLFHSVPIWSLSGQEIRAMLAEAIARR